jgi:SAM-dependent methyltransferase
MGKETLDSQREHWEETFAEKPEMFGADPSDPARKAVEIFKREGITKILELGRGQDRGTIFFAQTDIKVYALDYSQKGLDAIGQKAKAAGLSRFILTQKHDIRRTLPFADDFFAACFSHMLFCMALTTAEMEFLPNEIRRVIKPRGLNIYTVRHTEVWYEFKNGFRQDGSSHMSGSLSCVLRDGHGKR